MNTISFCIPLSGLLLCPLLPGVINRVKAIFAGRKGPPLLQLYFDLARLLRKGAVYSSTTTWVFRAGPVIALAALLACLLITPLGHIRAVISFGGDFVLYAYFLALARYAVVLAALDTGSAFEGMGASREVQFSMLAEPALFLAIAVLALQSGSWSLSGMSAAVLSGNALQSGAVYILVLMVLSVIFLVENSRIPVDDPNTHLELTMIHEVMVLDHSGPDLAFIEYGAALKMWLLGSLIAGIFDPFGLQETALAGRFPLTALIAAILTLLLLAALTGVLESSMARLRLKVVPRLITTAAVLAAIALTFSAG